MFIVTLVLATQVIHKKNHRRGSPSWNMFWIVLTRFSSPSVVNMPCKNCAKEVNEAQSLYVYIYIDASKKSGPLNKANRKKQIPSPSYDAPAYGTPNWTDPRLSPLGKGLYIDDYCASPQGIQWLGHLPYLEMLSSHNRRYFYGCVAPSQSTPKNCPLFLFTSNTLDITSCWLVPLLVLPDRPIWFARKTKCRSRIKQGWKIKHIQNHSKAPTTCKTRLGCCCDRTACHILPPLFFRLVADVANSRTNKPFLTYRLGARGPSSGPERFWHRLGMTW